VEPNLPLSPNEGQKESSVTQAALAGNGKCGSVSSESSPVPGQDNSLLPQQEHQMLRKPNNNERIIQVVVPRQDERTCAVVRALVLKTFGDDWDEPTTTTRLLMGAVQLAVTQWFHNTGRGKQVVATENNFDFNVGDLAVEVGSDFTGDASVHFDESDLCWFLQQHGIVGMEIDTFESDDLEYCWDFDDKLYDEMEVGS
jgi:hypothetical protein